MAQQDGTGGAQAARQITLTFEPDVEVGHVHAAVADLLRNLKPGGCSGCGLVGVDVTIRSGDPEVFRGVKDVLHSTGVIGVDVQR
ncbi:hypothetical protein [Kitasatospora nipponensis]